MKTIWKFQLEVTDLQTIAMPGGAEILSVQVQAATPYIWALVEPGAASEPRHIRMCGTGHPIKDEPGEYIGSFQLRGGMLVFHAFDATGGQP